MQLPTAFAQVPWPHQQPWCLCRSFGDEVTSWATFNEPGVYTFSGYCMGSFPPGKHFHFGLAGRVLKHMMICHSEAYKLIKGLPGKHGQSLTKLALKPCSVHTTLNAA